MQVIILTSGSGSKMWPYSSIRNKSLIPISNTPLIKILISYLVEYNVDIVLSCDAYLGNFKKVLKEYTQITYIEQESKGSSDSLLKLKDTINTEEPFVVLFGDVYYSKEDIERLLQSERNTLLLDKLKEHSKNWIACKIENECVIEIGGHFRNDELQHRTLGGKFTETVFEYLEKNPGYFENVRVGVSSPNEFFLEQSLQQMIHDGIQLQALKANGFSMDIDKPWHVLEANKYHNNLLCSRIEKSEIHQTVFIHNSASIEGTIRVHENSKIGKNCVFKGNAIVGRNTVIDNGVIIGNNVVIGDDCIIQNNVNIADNTTIGNRCQMSNSFEMLGGMFFDHVYAVHYGLFFGIVGESSDFGANTTIGNLRFDDQPSEHKVKNRKEFPLEFGNAVYLGDFVRTGICAMLMPGVKVGSRSVVGSGVLLDYDVEDDSIVLLKQEHITKKWGSNKYGW